MQIDFEVFDRLCTEKGKSQSAAAEEAGVSKNAIGRWRSGEVVPSKASVKKIADYFGVSVGYLLGDEKQKNPTTENDSGISKEKSELIEKIKRMSDAKLARVNLLIQVLESE